MICTVPGILAGLCDKHLPKMQRLVCTLYREFSFAGKDHMQVIAAAPMRMKFIAGKAHFNAAGG